MQEKISVDNFANIMGVSKATLQLWEANGTYTPKINKDGTKYFHTKDLLHVPNIREMIDSSWEQEMQIRPVRSYSSIELFAGAGGLALGMEKAGLAIPC